MTRKQLVDLGLEKEIINSIMAIHGEDTENWKAEKTELQNQFNELKKSIPESNGEDWKKKYEDAIKLSEEATGNIARLTEEIEAAKAQHVAELSEVRNNSLLNEAIAPYKFSSKYARNGVIDTLKGKIKIEDGKLIGFTEAINELMESEPEVFITENTDTKTQRKNEGKPLKTDEVEEDLFVKGFNSKI